MEFTDKGREAFARVTKRDRRARLRAVDAAARAPPTRSSSSSASRSRSTTRSSRWRRSTSSRTPRASTAARAPRSTASATSGRRQRPRREPAHRRAADRAQADLEDAGLGDARQAGAAPGPARGRRRPGADDPLPARSSTACSAWSATVGAADLRGPPVRAGQADPDHADAAGHRGPDPHAGGGGRREHRHLRANQGGGARRADRSRPPSPRGYAKALRTIIDANVVTIGVAFILFMLATAGVKGFAFTLGIGTLVSLFTAVLATSAILGSMARTPAAALAAARSARGRERSAGSASTSWASRSWFFSMSGVILAVGAIAIASARDQLRHRLRVRHADQDAARAGSASVDQVRDALDAARLRRREDPGGRRPGARRERRSRSRCRDARAGRRSAGRARRSTTSFGVRRRDFSSSSIGPTFGAADRAHGADRGDRVAAPDLDLHRASASSASSRCRS